MSVPLSVLDLTPIPAGSTTGEALGNTLDLARRTEAFGYRRYWVAEHHLNPGVAGSAPAVLIGLVASATSTIRVGSGAVLTGHQTPLAVTEQFGLLDAVFPGRIDLGLGRSGRPRASSAATAASAPASPPPTSNRVVDGLVVPPPFPVAELIKSPRFRVQSQLLQQPSAVTPDFSEILDQFQGYVRGDYSRDGVDVHVQPGEGAGFELWILGSSAGESAQEAGARGLPFGTNYHVAPAGVLDAVAGYRAAFRPGVLSSPRVIVSADVVVAETDEQAAELASPYGLWVLSIRSAQGAIPFPTPRRPPSTSGRRPSGPSCRTASTPSSWARRPRSWRSCGSCRRPPAPTNC